MSYQCTSCGRIVSGQHNCRDADEADIKQVRDSLEEALRRVHAIQDTEASELASAIDELIKVRVYGALNRR